MELLTQNDLPLQKPTAVAIGLFDGIHAGHKALIDEIDAHKELMSVVYTFDTKPSHAAYKNIYTVKEKIDIFECMGVEALYMQPFTEEFSRLTKEEFLQRLVNDFCARHITVGFDFRFGKNAEGDAAFLRANADRYGYTVSIIPEVGCEEGKVSSTLIRAHIERGQMEQTARLLDRFYFIDGRIEKGKKLGSAIGFPTANMSTEKLLPRYGVYATIVQIDGKCYPAVTNVGVKPTVTDEGIPNIETFIFDFSGDVYDEKMRVNFVSFIRGEKAFANVEELSAEIARNADTAREMLSDLSVYKKYLLC